jgi:AraC-like DNA-binding protein
MNVELVRVRYLVDHVWAYERLGGNVDRLLREARLSPTLLESPQGVVPLQRLAQLVLAATREVGPSLGAAAAPHRLSDLGELGAHLSRAASLRQAFDRFARLARAEATGATFFSTHHRGSLWLCRAALPGFDERLLVQVERYVVEVLLSIARHWLGPTWRPEELWLLSEPQAGDDPFAEIPRIRYRAPMLGFPVSLRDAHDTTAPPSTDPGTPSHGDPLPLDELSFVESLARLIETHLPAGRVSLPELSELLGTSPRTIQRRLDEHGTVYSSLLADVRQNLALTRLRTTDAPVTEIAQELGYSDSAHFARAFRRWAGVSPLELRRRLRMPSTD